MKRLAGILLTLVLTNIALANAAIPFSAKCELTNSHEYNFQTDLENKSVLNEDWTVRDNMTHSVVIRYSGGDTVDIEDSQFTRKTKAAIISENNSILIAVYLGEGMGGATTVSYLINLEAKSLILSKLAGGTMLGNILRGEIVAKSTCKFD